MYVTITYSISKPMQNFQCHVFNNLNFRASSSCVNWIWTLFSVHIYLIFQRFCFIFCQNVVVSFTYLKNRRSPNCWRKYQPYNQLELIKKVSVLFLIVKLHEMRMIIKIIHDNVFKGHFIRSFQKLMKRTKSFNPKKWFHFINCELKSGTFVKHGNFAKVTINHTDCIMCIISASAASDISTATPTIARNNTCYDTPLG